MLILGMIVDDWWTDVSYGVIEKDTDDDLEFRYVQTLERSQTW